MKRAYLLDDLLRGLPSAVASASVDPRDQRVRLENRLAVLVRLDDDAVLGGGGASGFVSPPVAVTPLAPVRTWS